MRRPINNDLRLLLSNGGSNCDACLNLCVMKKKSLPPPSPHPSPPGSNYMIVVKINGLHLEFTTGSILRVLT